MPAPDKDSEIAEINDGSEGAQAAQATSEPAVEEGSTETAAEKAGADAVETETVDTSQMGVSQSEYSGKHTEAEYNDWRERLKQELMQEKNLTEEQAEAIVNGFSNADIDELWAAAEANLNGMGEQSAYGQNPYYPSPMQSGGQANPYQEGSQPYQESPAEQGQQEDNGINERIDELESALDEANEKIESTEEELEKANERNKEAEEKLKEAEEEAKKKEEEAKKKEEEEAEKKEETAVDYNNQYNAIYSLAVNNGLNVSLGESSTNVFSTGNPDLQNTVTYKDSHGSTYQLVDNSGIASYVQNVTALQNSYANSSGNTEIINTAIAEYNAAQNKVIQRKSDLAACLTNLNGVKTSASNSKDELTVAKVDQLIDTIINSNKQFFRKS